MNRCLRLQHYRRNVLRTYFPWTRHIKRSGRIAGQLEDGSKVSLEVLCVVAWVAKCEDGFLRRPRGEAIDFKASRVATNPMRVLQDACILARPLRCFRQHVPVLG